jgi:hypothetical protein
MIHARPDYNRIQDPALHNLSLLAPGCSAIGSDEPVFLVRAGDKTAAATVRAWADINELAGADPEIVRIARSHADLMDAWPRKKQADLPHA